MILTTARGALLAAALGLAVPAGQAGAQGIPVIDASSIAQLVAQFEQLREDYAVQIDQFNKLQEQYVMLQQQYAAVTGPRGIGGLLNTVDDIRNRSAADTLGSILDGSISGDFTGMAGNVTRIAARLDDLRTEYDLGDLEDFGGSDDASDRAIAASAGAGMTAIATADDTYARATDGARRVNALIDQIDATPDIKASTDLNSRLLAEVAVLLNETLRVQAATANAHGAETLSNARAMAAQRKFMKVGN